MSDHPTEGATRAVDRLTRMIVLFAGLIGLLSALIALTETPDLAYNGGPMAIALSVLVAVMILYAQVYRDKYVSNGRYEEEAHVE